LKAARRAVYLVGPVVVVVTGRRLEAQAQAAQVPLDPHVRDTTEAQVAALAVASRLVVAAAQAALVVVAMAPPVQGQPLTLKAPRFFTPEVAEVVATLLMKTLRGPEETEITAAVERPEETVSYL
jgi:hypothetical protein